MKIYLAHPINGLSYLDIVTYFEGTALALKDLGYEVLQPMTAKGYLRNEKAVRSEGYSQPISSNHAIFERDQWMVRQSDILLCDLSGKSGYSIGCTMEVAWGSILGKHTLVVMPKDSEYRHAFYLEAADIVFESLPEALDYLGKLAKGSQ